MRPLPFPHYALMIIATAALELAATEWPFPLPFTQSAAAQQSAAEEYASETSIDALNEHVVREGPVTWSDETPFALVELFTSEGCSSCPAADTNLSAVINQSEKDNTRVFGLSYHVDYWNRLGWVDPFSLSKATERQQIYARVFRQNQVYTPQMIVNGKSQFVGSNTKQSRTAIANSLEVKPRSRIGLRVTSSDSAFTVAVKTQNTHSSDLILVALVQDHGQQQVTRGENTGANLKHSNIVRDFRVAQLTNGAPVIQFSRPDNIEPQRLQFIAFVQSRSTAEITSAISASVE